MSEPHVAHTKSLNITQNLTESRGRFASHAGVFRGARLSSLPTRDEGRALLNTPAWEASGRCTVTWQCLFLTTVQSASDWILYWMPKRDLLISEGYTLSLVRDEASVRYEWLRIQSFYIFIRFQAGMLRHSSHGMQSIRNILHKRTSYPYTTTRISGKANSSRNRIPV